MFILELKRLKYIILAFVVLGFVTNLIISGVEAQFQVTPFSGSSIDSYQCFARDGSVDDSLLDYGGGDPRRLNGFFLCKCFNGNPPNSSGICAAEGIDEPTSACDSSNTDPNLRNVPGDPGCYAQQAGLKPPAFQQLEIWFIRIVYVVWAVIGSLSSFFLVVLAYRYLISRGDITKLTEIRQKIIFYIIGIFITFLAIPILTTFFNVLGVDRNIQCYDVELPGFRFFFDELCTDPGGVLLDQACGKVNQAYNSGGQGAAISEALRVVADGELIGIVCQSGQTSNCSGEALIGFKCVDQSYAACLNGRFLIFDQIIPQCNEI